MPTPCDVSLSLSDRPLFPRQETFRLSYVYFPNAGNAAREAGYEAGSERQQGHRSPPPAARKNDDK